MGQLAYNKQITYDGRKILSTIKRFLFSPYDGRLSFIAFLIMSL